MAESSTLSDTNTVTPSANNEEVVEKTSIDENSYYTLEALKQQLEYYFSAQNLAKDTFLQSILLQSKNHFCNIDTLSRFSNVIRICESLGDAGSITDMLVQAAEMSEYLVVHRSEDGAATLMGIGPKVVVSSVPRNTIILREVSESVTEDDVRALFESSDKWNSGKCPVSIKSLKEEVGNNWFVTVNGSDEDIVSTMLSLRSMSLNDQPVKARLKTESAVAKAVYASPPSIQAPTSYGYNQSNNTRNVNDGKVQQSRQGGNGTSKIGYNKQYGSKQSSKQQSQKLQQPPKKIERASPPPMGDSHFPALGGKSMDTFNEDSSEAVIDTTPTVVTEEETVESPKVPVGGYAAALLKAAPPASQKPPSSKAESSQIEKNKVSSNAKKGINSQGKKENSTPAQKTITDSSHASNSKTTSTVKDDSSTSVSSSESPIPVPPPTWGSKKSFADILKAKQEKEQAEEVAKNQ